MRPFRILRSPEIESDGGSLTDEFVMISRVELDELRAKADEGPSSRANAGGLAAAREDFVETLKARETSHSLEIAARDQKAAGFERAYKNALRDRELATALIAGNSCQVPRRN